MKKNLEMTCWMASVLHLYISLRNIWRCNQSSRTSGEGCRFLFVPAFYSLPFCLQNTSWWKTNAVVACRMLLASCSPLITTIKMPSPAGTYHNYIMTSLHLLSDGLFMTVIAIDGVAIYVLPNRRQNTAIPVIKWNTENYWFACSWCKNSTFEQSIGPNWTLHSR